MDSKKTDYRAPGAAIKGMGTQVVSYSNLPVREKCVRRALTIQVNKEPWR